MQFATDKLLRDYASNNFVRTFETQLMTFAMGLRDTNSPVHLLNKDIISRIHLMAMRGFQETKDKIEVYSFPQGTLKILVDDQTNRIYHSDYDLPAVCTDNFCIWFNHGRIHRCSYVGDAQPSFIIYDASCWERSLRVSDYVDSEIVREVAKSPCVAWIRQGELHSINDKPAVMRTACPFKVDLLNVLQYQELRAQNLWFHQNKLHRSNDKPAVVTEQYVLYYIHGNAMRIDPNAPTGIYWNEIVRWSRAPYEVGPLYVTKHGEIKWFHSHTDGEIEHVITNYYKNRYIVCIDGMCEIDLIDGISQDGATHVLCDDFAYDIPLCFVNKKKGKFVKRTIHSRYMIEIDKYADLFKRDESVYM